MTKDSCLDFNKLVESVLAYRRSKPLLVALHYDLFTWIERGRDTVGALARGLKLDRRAVGILLDATAGLGFLAKRGERYRNTPLSRKFLVSSSPQYRGSVLKCQEQLWDAWSDLKGVVKSGRPRRGLVEWVHQEAFTGDYIRAMGDVAREAAQDLAGKLDLRGVERSLDVGCGAGAYSAALVERSPRIEATLLDLPPTLAVTRSLLGRHRHARRFRFRPGDFLKDGLGRGEFDLALISNVTHCESAANNRTLVAKAAQALRPGGRLVIHDYLAASSPAAARFTATLAVHLLVFTGRGNVYNLKDYAGWMRRAGLRRVACKPVAAGSVYPSTAIIGHKT
jgi:SAM-dependent methyltransferase